MSLPLCPVCGTRDLKVVDRAEEIRPAGDPAHGFIEMTVHRSYRCPTCPFSCWSEETITVWNPATLYLRKLATETQRAG